MQSDRLKGLRQKFTDRTLNVELTNSCNLRCPLCSTGSGFDQKKKGMMEFDRFKKFFNECYPLFDKVDFIGSGEPGLHLEFPKFVDYVAHKMKKRTIVSTNGTALRMSEEIVRSGLHVIYVDIDGVTQAKHQAYRIGSDLKSVIRKIEDLVKVKQALSSWFPEIYVSSLINRYNESDYDQFVEMAQQLGVNGIRFSTIHNDLFGGTDWLPTLPKFKPVERDVPYDCTFQNSLAGYLRWDGDIQLCCMSPHHKTPVVKANVFEKSNVFEILDSERFYKLTRNAGKFSFCRNCFFANYSTFGETIVFEKTYKRSLKGLVRRYSKDPLSLVRMGLKRVSDLGGNILFRKEN